MSMNDLSGIKLLITGGGTGGHLFPGIALAQAVEQAYGDSEVLFVGTERKIDIKALANLGFIIKTIRCNGLKGKSFTEILSALFQLPVALFDALKIIRQFKPDLVFGVGGYVTGPVILAARLLGITTCIHEQNTVPGLANKMLGRIAHRIFVSLPGSDKYFPAGKTILSGNPVRSSLLAKAREVKQQDMAEQSTILILGGSQGARRLNSLVLEAAEQYLVNQTPRPVIIHQTGEADKEDVKKVYAELGIDVQVKAFISDMAEVYAQADLIVSRAGATTLAEIMVFSKPAILVPYPYAADNHQEKNGRILVEGGGGVMFKQSELTGEILGNEICRLLNDKKLLNEMADKSGKLAKPDATETIVNSCFELLKSKVAPGTRKHLAF
jgi:UDP-N-acetylglucosamine--N-acetylmuramyl-(pentapeptide) pyrophosphoryl-undecaprenol N-acetylglucosamine transferase